MIDLMTFLAKPRSFASVAMELAKAQKFVVTLRYVSWKAQEALTPLIAAGKIKKSSGKTSGDPDVYSLA